MAMKKDIFTAEAQRRRGRKDFQSLHWSAVRPLERKCSMVAGIIRNDFSLRLSDIFQTSPTDYIHVVGCASAMNDFKGVNK